MIGCRQAATNLAGSTENVLTVASEAYRPVPQTRKQRETEIRLYALADAITPRLGMSRRSFFGTAAGMGRDLQH